MRFICFACKLYALHWGKYGRLLLTVGMSRLTVQVKRHLVEANAVKYALLHPAVLQSKCSPFRSPSCDLTHFLFSLRRILVIGQSNLAVN